MDNNINMGSNNLNDTMIDNDETLDYTVFGFTPVTSDGILSDDNIETLDDFNSDVQYQPNNSVLQNTTSSVQPLNENIENKIPNSNLNVASESNENLIDYGQEADVLIENPVTLKTDANTENTDTAKEETTEDLIDYGQEADVLIENPVTLKTNDNTENTDTAKEETTEDLIDYGQEADVLIENPVALKTNDNTENIDTAKEETTEDLIDYGQEADVLIENPVTLKTNNNTENNEELKEEPTVNVEESKEGQKEESFDDLINYAEEADNLIDNPVVLKNEDEINNNKEEQQQANIENTIDYSKEANDLIENPVELKNDVNNEKDEDNEASQNNLNAKDVSANEEIKEEETSQNQENVSSDVLKSDSPDNKVDNSNTPSSKEGKFSILDKYGEELTKREYVCNPAIGRDNEIKQLILTLLTPDKSAILVGKPGIGKTAIVEGLSYQIQKGNIPDALKDYAIYKINTSSLLGFMPDTNEPKIQALLNDLKGADKLILFIDEIHTLIGTGNGNSESMDFANIFKPGLDRGSIKVIGATTTDEYDRYILTDKAFVRRFQKIDVLEPTREHTIKILMGSLPKIEKKTGAKLKYTPFIQEKIMAFIVDITSEYRRVYELSARYPDISLTILQQAFSYAVFDNKKEVSIRDVRKAIANTKLVYPDVIKKELIRFNDEFSDIYRMETIQRLKGETTLNNA